jgi:hypothetical protein
MHRPAAHAAYTALVLGDEWLPKHNLVPLGELTGQFTKTPRASVVADLHCPCGRGSKHPLLARVVRTRWGLVVAARHRYPVIDHSDFERKRDGEAPNGLIHMWEIYCEWLDDPSGLVAMPTARCKCGREFSIEPIRGVLVDVVQSPPRKPGLPHKLILTDDLYRPHE